MSTVNYTVDMVVACHSKSKDQRRESCWIALCPSLADFIKLNTDGSSSSFVGAGGGCEECSW